MANIQAFQVGLRPDGKTFYVEPWGGVVTLEEAVALAASLLDRITKAEGGADMLKAATSLAPKR